MINISNYIDTAFSKELKLLIFLSKEDTILECTPAIDDLNWNLFIKLLKKHRLVSHIIHNEKTTSYIPVTVYKQIKSIHLEQIKKSLLFNSELLKITQSLSTQKIKHAFFKGSLLSYELYNDIAFRNFRDIDVIIERNNLENAVSLLAEMDYLMLEPKHDLNDKQKRINYKLSHHYHLRHTKLPVDIELHWNLTNPQSFASISSRKILSQKTELLVHGYKLPYISQVENIVFLAAHGSIHQWYRLFWLKDFSVILSKTNTTVLWKSYELALKLKLGKCFLQACFLSKELYGVSLPESFTVKSLKKIFLLIPLESISTTELKQRGILGKLRYVFYRLRLKPDFKYYFDLIYRLRTHFSDWEIIKLPAHLFFLYYPLRPFLLLFKMFRRN